MFVATNALINLMDVVMLMNDDLRTPRRMSSMVSQKMFSFGRVERVSARTVTARAIKIKTSMKMTATAFSAAMMMTVRSMMNDNGMMAVVVVMFVERVMRFNPIFFYSSLRASEFTFD